MVIVNKPDCSNNVSYDIALKQTMEALVFGFNYGKKPGSKKSIESLLDAYKRHLNQKTHR